MKDKKEQKKKIVDSLAEVFDEVLKTPTEKISLRLRLKWLYRFTRISKLDNTDEDVINFKKQAGEQFRERRKLFKLSQTEVAKRALRDQKTISDIENGTAHIGLYPFAMLALEFCIADLPSNSKEKAETLEILDTENSVSA